MVLLLTTTFVINHFNLCTPRHPRSFWERETILFSDRGNSAYHDKRLKIYCVRVNITNIATAWRTMRLRVVRKIKKRILTGMVQSLIIASVLNLFQSLPLLAILAILITREYFCYHFADHASDSKYIA